MTTAHHLVEDLICKDKETIIILKIPCRLKYWCRGHKRLTLPVCWPCVRGNEDGVNGFFVLTVAELVVVVKAWAGSRHDIERGKWEKLRISVCLTLQPFLSEQRFPLDLSFY